VWVARKGELLDASSFPGFVADVGHSAVGLAVVAHRDEECESSLNVRAFAFYQHVGLDLCAFYPHGVDNSRRIKPAIPARDTHGIPIRHELEFELRLDTAPR
jgi:hypothetical protein